MRLHLRGWYTAYVEFHDTIRDHPKTVELMLALGVTRREAVGIIGCLSTWAIRFRPTGVLERKYIKVAVEWEREESVLIDSLVKSGWIDELDGDQYAIHDWEDVTRNYRRARADYERQKEFRRSLQGKNKHKKRSMPDQNKVVARPEEGPCQVGAERSGAERSREEPPPLPKVFSKPSSESEVCVEPSNGSTPTAAPEALVGLDLYLQDQKLCKNIDALIESWTQAFPAVDILAEIRKAHAWEVSNPERRKINRAKFLHSWLSRVQDHPGAFGARNGSNAVEKPRSKSLLLGE